MHLEIGYCEHYSLRWQFYPKVQSKNDHWEENIHSSQSLFYLCCFIQCSAPVVKFVNVAQEKNSFAKIDWYSDYFISTTLTLRFKLFR